MPGKYFSLYTACIADGNYDITIPTDISSMKSSELVKLADTINILSSNTKTHIDSLNDMSAKREEFISNFTHEIKTPLTSIIGYGDLLRTYDVSPQKRREYVEYLYCEGTRLENLSLRLLELIVLEQQNIDLSPVNTSIFFNSLRDSVRFISQKYSVTVEFDTAPSCLLIEPVLFTTAIVNFIDNACKASETGKTITVKGSCNNDSYTIQIIDYGRGIPADEIEHITEPFYTVDKSRSRKQGGAGLRLALASKIVSLHNMKFNISSRPGIGTTVSVSDIRHVSAYSNMVNDNYPVMIWVMIPNPIILWILCQMEKLCLIINPS